MRSHFYPRDRGVRVLVEVRIEALRNFSPGQLLFGVKRSGLAPHFFAPRALLLPPLCDPSLTELANVRREMIMHSESHSLGRTLGVNREPLWIEPPSNFLPGQTLFEAKGFGSVQSFGAIGSPRRECGECGFSRLGHPLGLRDVEPRFDFERRNSCGGEERVLVVSARSWRRELPSDI